MGITKEIIQSIRMLLRYAILYLYYTYKTMSFVKVCVLHIIVMSQLVTRSKFGRHKADDIAPLIFYVRNI